MDWLLSSKYHNFFFFLYYFCIQFIHREFFAQFFRDAMCALEWKTSEKSKPKLSSTYDAPIQICAYLGALNVDKRHSHRSTNGYVVVAYKDGTPANSFFMSDADVKRYWQLWLKRLHEYWIRKRDGTLPEPI